jgi:hypothetical protein
MSDITHMGLPQGLPEMVTAACPRWKADDGKTYEYNPWFHSYREVDERREMTAADLGLRKPDFIDQNGDGWFYVGPAWYASGAPYSFWLGADHG